MKKSLAFLLAFAIVITPFCFDSSECGDTVYAADVESYIGDMRVTKINGVFTDPTVNVMILLTPGQSLGALYYARLLAEYDSTSGAYVVKEKIATHRSSSTKVGANCIGLAFNYAPLTSTGMSFSRANWLVWDRIRVGDKLTLSGIDLTNNTLDTSGTWGTSNFVSNALIKVTTVRDSNAPKTAFSQKKIVAMGDSVTVGGGWTEAIGAEFNTDVINSGFGGDTSTNYYSARYQQYVAAYEPDIVFVSFGVNDALSAKGSAAGITTYKNTLRQIYQSNTAMGAKTIFMTPNNIKIASYDGSSYSAYGGLQGYLDAFLGGMKEVAAEYGCHFIDLYSMWKAKGLAPDNLIDGTHPNSYGYDQNIELILSYLRENMNDICDVPDHPTELTLKMGSNVYISESFLMNVETDLSVDGVKALFNEDGGYMSVRNANGTVMTNGFAGTGCTVELVVDGNVLDSYKIVVNGDVSGDGSIASDDYMLIKLAIMETITLDDGYALAADYDGSKGISTTDLMLMKLMLIQ